MFRNRDDEIRRIEDVIYQDRPTAKAILIYGRRRVGKTTLLEQVKRRCRKTFIFFTATESKYEIIVSRFAAAVAEEMKEDFYRQIKDIHAILMALKATGREFVIAIDEYQYMKSSYKEGNLDSLFQAEMQQLSGSFTFIFSGSYVSQMKRMGSASEPLFGRFQLSLNLKPFDYLDASAFYSDLSPYEKIGFYAVFGGYPFVLDYIHPDKNLRWNIENVLLDTKGYVHTSLRYALLREIFRLEMAEFILLVLGNGKARNSEIASALSSSTSNVSIELKKLLDMEIITSTFPINRNKDEKKKYYEISDNLLRFFYAYILPNENEIDLRGSSAFYNRFIEPSITDFIARRFEKMVPEYLRRLIRLGKADDIIDIGTYWYDKLEERKNGEFDCVVKKENGFTIIECKYLKDKMTESLASSQAEKIRKINGIDVRKIGFASANGFDFDSSDFLLISGEDIYNP